MPLGTSSISGISSGIDWQSIIEKLRQVEHQRIDLLESKKSTYQEKLTAWQSINTKLLSLKTAASALNRSTDFDVYKTSLATDTATAGEDILSASATADAAPGSYSLVVKQLASAQKLSSASFASQTAELGMSGDIVVGGRTVTISSTDTVLSLRDKINAVDAGTNASHVSASIVNFGTSGYRLILTSAKEGAAGISLLNGGAADLLGLLGFVDASVKTAKNAGAGGHKSDAFSAADEAIGSAELLSLTNPQSGTVTITINGVSRDIAIDLSSDSLNSMRDAINAGFSGTFSADPASVISESIDGTTKYMLMIKGDSITYTDADNVLETCGILERAGSADEMGVIGDVANTTDGNAITGSTRFDQIDGYLDYATSDTIALSGTDTSGGVVNAVFSIFETGYKTIADLLHAIESSYGNVTASITADGRLQVVDNELGDSDLQVILSPSKGGLNFATGGDLGSLGTIRKRELQAGLDAEITVDGVALRPPSNTVGDVIAGVTLMLKEAAPDTQVTLTVGRDYDAVKEKISGLVTAYNDAMDAIGTQLKYDFENNKPGGPLYGDSTLRSMKSSVTNIILGRVSGASQDFSTLGLVGISVGTDGKLTLDDAKLQKYLESNFGDIKKLFAAECSSTNGEISYVYHGYDTQAGTYSVSITGVDPLGGYFGQAGEASVSGEFLTGLSGDTKGLVIRYSGSATGNVGSVILTYGVAELMDRALYHLTEPVDGILANKEETIQGTMDSLTNRIDRMEEMLDRRMETLTSSFLAMETALSTMQSQSDWLAGQLSAATNGWGT